MVEIKMSEICEKMERLKVMLEQDINPNMRRSVVYVKQQKLLISDITEMNKNLSSRSSDYYYLNFMNAMSELTQNFNEKYKLLIPLSFVSCMTRDYLISFSKELDDIERELTLEYLHISSIPNSLTTKERDDLIKQIRTGIGVYLFAYYGSQQGERNIDILPSDCWHNIFLLQMIEYYISERIPIVDKQIRPILPIVISHKEQCI